ncbi:MAG: sulfotransferase family protein [bacterium]
MNLKKWVRETINRRRLRNLAQHGDIKSPDKWLFIVGCYNSGTTLLHDVLASHPDVGVLPREGQYCTDQFLIPGDIGLARGWALAPERFLLDEQSPSPPDPLIVQRQWSNQIQPEGKKIYLEKSITNTARIRWLNHHFPNAYFVALVRNGYAVAEGIRRKSQLNLEQAAQQWRISNEIMMDSLNKVDHAMTLSYEAFTADPATAIERVITFADLRHHSLVNELQQWQVHGVTASITNMNEKSIKQLSEQDKALIEKHAGSMLRSLGYLEEQ